MRQANFDAAETKTGKLRASPIGRSKGCVTRFAPTGAGSPQRREQACPAIGPRFGRYHVAQLSRGRPRGRGETVLGDPAAGTSGAKNHPPGTRLELSQDKKGNRVERGTATTQMHLPRLPTPLRCWYSLGGPDLLPRRE